jgi:hypothetical protein
MTDAMLFVSVVGTVAVALVIDVIVVASWLWRLQNPL